MFLEYLDDVYGEEKVYGTDPMRKAAQKLLVQDFEKKVQMSHLSCSAQPYKRFIEIVTKIFFKWIWLNVTHNL